MDDNTQSHYLFKGGQSSGSIAECSAERAQPGAPPQALIAVYTPVPSADFHLRHTVQHKHAHNPTQRTNTGLTSTVGGEDHERKKKRGFICIWPRFHISCQQIRHVDECVYIRKEQMTKTCFQRKREEWKWDRGMSERDSMKKEQPTGRKKGRIT